jgi:hypothetical protein
MGTNTTKQGAKIQLKNWGLAQEAAIPNGPTPEATPAPVGDPPPSKPKSDPLPGEPKPDPIPQNPFPEPNPIQDPQALKSE